MEFEDQQPMIFLSYASQDRERVLPFYEFLNSEGFDTWIDVRKLKAGQNWDFEIRRALDSAAVVIVFISNNSIDKRGYVQREIKISLKKLEEKLPDDVYIIPVRLDKEAAIPTQINDIHVVTGDDDNCRSDVLEAVKHAIEQRGTKIAKIQEDANLTWMLNRYTDEWDGLPGYSSSFEWFALRSTKYKRIGEISEIIKGEMLKMASGSRKIKFEQNTEFHNFGEDRSRREDAWEASCPPPTVQGRIISFQYSLWWYGAKAAHPNFGFQTFNYLVDPVVEISLEGIFFNADEALAVLQEEIRNSITGPSGEKDSDYPLDKEWVERGTSTWDEIANYTFGENGINFVFGAYAVAPYAWGPQFANVPYDRIAKMIRPEFRSALDIYYSEAPNWPFELKDINSTEELDLSSTEVGNTDERSA